MTGMWSGWDVRGRGGMEKLFGGLMIAVTCLPSVDGVGWEENGMYCYLALFLLFVAVFLYHIF